VILCVHLPRFELTVAAGGARALAGTPLAIAPNSGTQTVGEVSGTAQAAGVADGMKLGEALARCPALRLVPEDPVGVARSWEQAARALESIGAQVELARPGLAYFDAAGMRGLHRDIPGVIAVARAALNRPSRIGGAPTRFCALAASVEARSSRARLIDERDVRRYLACQPVRLLGYREQTAPIVAPLMRLGITTLGALADLGAGHVADRFGEPGILARRLAQGHDTPLVTRTVEERLEESMPVGDCNSGEALARTLVVLVDRLLARPERRGRPLRSAMLSAQLVERGTWCETVVFREAISDRTRMRLALAAKLSSLPAPVETLTLTVHALAPAVGDQTTLLDGERIARNTRLKDTVRQVCTIAGPHAVLRLTPVNVRSRLPERTHILTPYIR